MNPQLTTPEEKTTAEHTTTATTTEQYRMTGEEVIAKIKQVVHEGNVRRVIIKNAKGNTLAEFPLTVGIVGVALIPMWAAVGALLALVAGGTIEIEKKV